MPALTSPTNAERRLRLRFACDWSAIVHRPAAAAARIVDANFTGVLVELNRPARVGECFEMTVNPGLGRPSLTVEARVVRRAQEGPTAGHGHLVGCELAFDSPQTRRAYTMLLLRHARDTRQHTAALAAA